MVRVSDELLIQGNVTLYHTTDSYLGNNPVLVFHGPSTISNSNLNNSRAQIHIFTSAGFQSYPRITISPNLPFHQSVDYLPREKQGDEVCRGIAFGLLKYFTELPDTAKSILTIQYVDTRGKNSSIRSLLFSEQHAAALASAMVKVENTAEVLTEIQSALRPQNINHIDLDFVLPPGSTTIAQEVLNEDPFKENSKDQITQNHREYSALIKLLGDVVFLPTSKLRRAPSRATSINKSRSFLKEQKQSLRREMGQLVDTEERYVIKVHELLHQIAGGFREKARNKGPSSLSPSEEDLEKLFPKSLDKILQVNSEFLNAVRKVMDETEEDSMLDLEAPDSALNNIRNDSAERPKDPTGALTFAKVLLEWFPQFSDCYQEYIRASQAFPQIITSFVKQQSSFSKRVQMAGEQQLRSAVIEPVQRLPRYSLFIDNIINCLPILHPALQPFLKAKDIITHICSMDPPEIEKSYLLNRIQNMIESWPTNFTNLSRLVTAVDYVESSSPFHVTPTTDSHGGIFLLFTDRIVLVKKSQRCSLSARGFLAEVDRPSASSMIANMTATASGQKRTYDISFSSCHMLDETRFTISDDGQRVSMVSIDKSRDSKLSAVSIRVFILQGGYERKGLKFTEEIIRARIEGRFSEAERESNLWSLRSVKPAATDLTIHAAIFEEEICPGSQGRKKLAPVRVVVDQDSATTGDKSSVHDSVEIIVDVKTITHGARYQLEVTGINNRVFLDELSIDQFLSTLVKRITDLLRVGYSLKNSILTAPFISFYTKILNSLHIDCEYDKYKYFKPNSPVKLLSNLFNTTPLIHSSKSSKSAGKIKFSSLNRSNSSRSRCSSQDVDSKSSSQFESVERPENHFIRLEETFRAYTTAIYSRKGHVIGRALRTRAMSDELSINAIYNTFIENPLDQRTASEVTINVLFSAFKKYLRLAWTDQMGDVISQQTLDELQIQALRLTSGDFADFVRLILNEMTPQNRRALISIIKLLADLLDGCNNDADRGAVTAAFAELLVIEGNPHDYINLLDRLVLDQENLFQSIGSRFADGIVKTAAHASNPATRPNTCGVSSVTSNNSSFRKRFAETLLRQNISGEKSSVWRSLSKNSRIPGAGEQVIQNPDRKASLRRSRSIETSGQRAALGHRQIASSALEKRPLSSSGVGYMRNNGEVFPSDHKKRIKLPRKKRRSSLSDLTTLNSFNTFSCPVDILDSPRDQQNFKDKMSLGHSSTSSIKIPMAGADIDHSRSSVYQEPTQKENKNSALNAKKRASLAENSLNNITSPSSTSDAVLIKDLWKTSHKKPTVLTTTSIPNLSGRPSTISSTTIPSRTNHTKIPSSPQKLRLQSPQKLRERIQNEAKAIKNAEADLHLELSEIGAQMARLHNAETLPSLNEKMTQTFSLTSLQLSLSSLTARIPNIIADLTARNEMIGTDLQNSLQALESKAKGLEQLYREAMAENELLYERFNNELARIVRAVKAKDEDSLEGGLGAKDVKPERAGRGELVDKIRESTEETAKFRRENARLKREVLSLKTLLKVAQ